MTNWKGCHCDYSCLHLTIRHINQAFSMTVFFQHLPLNTLSSESIFGLYRYLTNFDCIYGNPGRCRDTASDIRPHRKSCLRVKLRDTCINYATTVVCIRSDGTSVQLKVIRIITSSIPIKITYQYPRACWQCERANSHFGAGRNLFGYSECFIAFKA